MFLAMFSYGSKHGDGRRTEAARKNGLHIQCSGCGYIIIAWWQTLGVPDDREVETL